MRKFYVYEEDKEQDEEKNKKFLERRILSIVKENSKECDDYFINLDKVIGE